MVNYSLIVLWALLCIFGSNWLRAQDSCNGLNKMSWGQYFFEKSEEFSKTNLDSCLHYTNIAKDAFVKEYDFEGFFNASIGIGNLYMRQGNFKRAYLEFEFLLSNKDCLEFIDHSILVKFYNALGVLSFKFNEFNVSREFFEKIVSSNFFPFASGAEKASIINNIGKCYENIGDYLSAKVYFQNSMTIRKSIQNELCHRIVGNFLDIASVHLSLGSIDSARMYLNWALKCDFQCVFNERLYVNTKIKVLLKYAESYLYDSNLFYKYYNEALLLSIESSNNEIEFLKSITLGKFHLESGNYPSSLNCFFDAINLSKKAYSSFPNRYHISKAYFFVAKIYYYLGESALVLDYLERADSVLVIKGIDKFFFGKDRAFYSDVLHGLEIYKLRSLVLGNSYEEKKVLEYLVSSYYSSLRGLTLLDSLRNTYFFESMKFKLSQEYDDFSKLALSNAIKLWESSQESKWLNEVQKVLESNRGIFIYEMINYKNALENSPSLDRFANDDSPEFKNFNAVLDIQNLYLNFFANRETLLNKVYNNRINKLPSSIISLYIIKLKTDYWLLSYGANGYRLKRINFNLDSLKLYRKGQGFWLNENDLFFEIASFLNEILSKDVDKLSHLIIIPDGELSNFPFELLLTKHPDSIPANTPIQDLPFLFKKVAISYQNSLSLFEIAQSMEKENSYNFAGFAPKFEGAALDGLRDCSEEDLSYLSCNQEEVDNIREIIGGRVFTNEDATKNNFLKEAKEAKIIHLATHACINFDTPKFSKLYFSDGECTTGELYFEDFNAELAVLSACNTGSGKIQEGEGVLSLARGFILAQVPSLITTLWPVDDCSTKMLMEYFYENLKKGMHKDVALQQAKIKYLETAPKEYLDPYYWAGTVQMGNIEPITFHYDLSLKYSVFGGALVLVFGLGWRKLRRRKFAIAA